MGATYRGNVVPLAGWTAGGRQMIRPSRDRITTLARQIVDELARSSEVHLLRDRESLRQSVIQVLQEEFRRDEDRVSAVLARLDGMDGVPRRGSAEWNQLWQKLLDEEYERTRFDGA